MAKGTAPNAVKDIARLSREATYCYITMEKTMIFYIKQYFIPAQFYLCSINADQELAKIQNLAVVLPSNANLSPHFFSTVMCSLVANTKHKSDKSVKNISIGVIEGEKVI